MQRKLTTIKEDDVLIDSTNELEQLQSEMLVVSNQIAQDFYKLKILCVFCKSYFRMQF